MPSLVEGWALWNKNAPKETITRAVTTTRKRGEINKASRDKNDLGTDLILMRTFCGRQRNSVPKVIQCELLRWFKFRYNFQSIPLTYTPHRMPCKGERRLVSRPCVSYLANLEWLLLQPHRWPTDPKGDLLTTPGKRENFLKINISWKSWKCFTYV